MLVGEVLEGYKVLRVPEVKVLGEKSLKMPVDEGSEGMKLLRVCG